MSEEFLSRNKKNSAKEREVFELAKKFDGEITLSEVYTHSHLALDEIEKILNELSSKDYIKMDFDEKTNIVKYVFPDFKGLNKNKKDLIQKTGLDKIILKWKYGDAYDNSKPTIELEKAVLKVAYYFKGKATISQILNYTKLSLEEAEAIISSLTSKGICKKEIQDSTVLYVFPELILDSDGSVKKGLFGNISQNIENNLDKFISRKKVKSFRRKKKNRIFLNTILPGFGLWKDGQISFAEYTLFYFLPLVFTAGLAYIPESFIARSKSLKHYSLSDYLYNKQKRSLNNSSIVNSIIFLLLYSYIMGLNGIMTYYDFLFDFLSF